MEDIIKKEGSDYADVRAMQFLSPDQRKQAEKKSFYATHVVDK